MYLIYPLVSFPCLVLSTCVIILPGLSCRLSLICWLLCFALLCFHSSRPLFCSSRSSTWKVFWDFPQPEDDRTGLMTPLGGETENIAEPSFSNFKNLFSEHVTNDTVPNTIPYHAN
jgi:hypothetical protein